MTTSQHNRRNFLSSLAILSVGSSFANPLNHLIDTTAENDLMEKWKTFYSKAGGTVTGFTGNLNRTSDHPVTPGHQHIVGKTIFFEKDNLLATPTWIFWNNDQTKPADVIIGIFQNDDSPNKITRLNRFDVEALFKLSKEHSQDQLLLALCNNTKPARERAGAIVKNKTIIYKNSQHQQVSFYKDESLVFQKKFIHHT